MDDHMKKVGKFSTYFFIGCIVGCPFVGTSSEITLSGPKLMVYPEPITHFSNSVGLTLTCTVQESGSSSSSPLITSWLTASGDESLPVIPGIRERLDNGSLHFPAFRADEYIASVHNGEYRCSLTNSVGTLLSPVFSVRAVIDEQSFEVSIKSGGDWLEGSPALLECQVNPPFYSQFSSVIAWKEIDQFGHEREIEFFEGRQSKYHVTSPQGSLLIFSAPPQRLYVCVIKSLLNSKLIKSSAPFLFKAKRASSINNHIPPQPLRSSSVSKIVLNENFDRNVKTSSVDLLCVVIGNPSPNFRWEKLESDGRWLPVHTTNKYTGPHLRLTYDKNDLESRSISGTYRCEATNAFGTSTTEYSLEIEGSPTISITPERVVANYGQLIEFTCQLKSGNAGHTANEDFVWYKNGKPILATRRMTAFPEKLTIQNVALEDQGVYQCFAGNGSAAAAHLIFPPSAPELVHTFISQSVQPGPSISLKCSATGNPAPVISWFIDDLMVSSSFIGSSDQVNSGERKYLWMSQQQRSRFTVGGFGESRSRERFFSSAYWSGEVVSYLNISSVHVEDGGMYKCTASNIVRAVSHTARLNVYGGLFVREMGSVTHAHGDTVHIPCHYGGYPVDKVIWQKDSRNLISNSNDASWKKVTKDNNRFSIFPNGTLKIALISSELDKGIYTCVVSNRKGELASGSVNINVMRPPVISNLKFDDHLQEGQRTSILCSVTSGDLPINIVWLKDGLPIPNHLKVTENRVRFLSVLAFDELSEEHSGEYTCSAENEAKTVKQCASLLVKVSPKWTRQLEDTKAVLGSQHAFQCTAKGVPTPNISWFRESSGVKAPLRTNHKFQVADLNGGSTLKIFHLDESDAGMYSCEASNGIGVPLSKSVHLSVIIPAKISSPPPQRSSASAEVVVVTEGASASLSCQIRGDLPLQVMWKKDSVLLQNSSSASQPRRVATLEKASGVNSTVLSAEFRIESSELADSGVYECVASNQYGRDERKIKLEVKARPLAPEDLTVEEIGSRFIRLKWSSPPKPSSPSSSTDPITHFLVEWKKMDDSDGTSRWEPASNLTIQAHHSNEAIIKSLHPVTNYAVRLYTRSKSGQSLPTAPLVVLTQAEPPSGPPLNVSAVPIGPKSILVKWVPPDDDMQHGTIQGYQVSALLVQPVPKYQRNKTVVVDVKLSEQTELDDLRPNSQYRVSVGAYNSAGMGPDSSFMFIQTPEGAPESPPINIQCEPLSPKSMQVHWEAPPEHLANGNILGYKVAYISVEGEKLGGEKAEVKKTSNKETTLHGLRSYTSYWVRVLAYTIGGESETSEPVQCSTEEDIPGEPADIKVICSTLNSVVVSWLSPKSPNGVIKKYIVFWKAEDSESVKEKQFVPLSASDSQFSTEIRRLKENLQYSFWVSAVTGAGVGKPSKMESVHVAPNIVPKIASFPVVKSVSVGESVQLPCLVFGLDSPRVIWNKNHAMLETKASMLRNNGTLVFGRVKDSDEGTYTCRAENEHGSDEVEHEIIISRPPGKVPMFIGYVTHSSIQVHWDTSGDQVHPPLIGYLLESRIENQHDDKWSPVKMGANVQSHVLEALRCGTQYQVRIAGVNQVGRGVYSDALSVKTNGGAPEEKPKLTEILDGNGSMIRVDLTRWPDGGCPITSFHLEYRRVAEGHQGMWIPVVRRTDNHSRVFTLHTERRLNYEIQVKVENDAGHVTRKFLVESHPDFFKNYAKVMERVEVGDGESNEKNGVVPFYTDPHVVVPIVSAVICTAAAAICLLMILIRRRNMRKASSEWKFTSGAIIGHRQQSWLANSNDLHKCSSNGEECGTTETTSIYATLNSTKPIPTTIRDSTVRLHSFGSHDNYDGAPLEQPHSISTGQYLKKAKRKSCGSSPLVEQVCMQQVSCQMEFPGPIEPPHEFRSSNSFPSQLQHYQHSGSDDTEDPRFTRRGSPSGFLDDTNDDSSKELYHDYTYPYHAESQSTRQTNTQQTKKSSRKLSAASRPGSKRNSKSDEYFE